MSVVLMSRLRPEGLPSTQSWPASTVAMMLLEERTPWATNYIQACQTWALMGMISFKVFKNKRLVEDAPSAVRVSSHSSCELQKSTEKRTPALLRLLAPILSSVISLAVVGKKTLMSVRLWEKLPR